MLSYELHVIYCEFVCPMFYHMERKNNYGIKDVRYGVVKEIEEQF
jgi:hypothetical protein